MSVAETVTWLGTIASGLVSIIILVSIVVDALTKGWVRSRVQRWLGIKGIRSDHRTTQVFMLDLGDSYNDLSERVCDELDIPEEERPNKVDTDGYEMLTEDGDNLSRGDFTRGGSDND